MLLGIRTEYVGLTVCLSRGLKSLSQPDSRLYMRSLSGLNGLGTVSVRSSQL